MVLICYQQLYNKIMYFNIVCKIRYKERSVLQIAKEPIKIYVKANFFFNIELVL